MDFNFDIGLWGAGVLIVGALAFGIAVYLFGSPGHTYEWLATSAAALVGGFVASEFFVDLRAWAPLLDGLALIPALVGGLAVGSIVVVAARLMAPAPEAARHA